MKIEEKKTRIYKSMRGGWEGRTIRTEKGQTFDICTLKRYSGNLVTTATKIEAKEDGGFICTMSDMTSEFLSINHGKVKATEKTVKNAHFEALALFDEKVQDMPETELKPKLPEKGDILFLDGYGKTKGSQSNHWIIYEITIDKWGTKYHCIEKDSLELQVNQYVKPLAKKFGIGTYFEKGFNMQIFGIDENQLANMLIEAQDVKRKKEEEQQKAVEEANKKAAETEKYLSQFKTADRRKTTNLIKKYCCEKFNISKIEVSTDVFSMGDSMRVKYYSPEKIEELESFIKTFQEGHFNGMEDIYEYNHDREAIIIYGHILQTYKYVFCDHEEGKGKQEKTKKSKNDNWLSEYVNANIQIIDYSEKAIAVIGETKVIKDLLKQHGGRFNPKLKCGPGWIFPKSKQQEIEKLI